MDFDNDHDDVFIVGSANHLEHGLSLVYDNIDRMCVNPSFANESFSAGR
jgi:hypothetical protein